MSAVKSYILVVLMPVLLTGCFAAKSFVYLEVLDPAPVTYPEDVSRIGYLNRAPVMQDQYSNIDPTVSDPFGTHIIDTIVSNNIRKGLFEGSGLTEISYMDDITALEARRKDTVGQTDIFDFRTRERILTRYSLDALIVLEYYHLRLSRSYTYYDISVGDYMQEFHLIMETLWRVYVKDSIAPLDEFLAIDTLYYYNYSDMPREEYMSITSVIREGSADVGFRYGIRHIPLWTEVSRVVFRGGEQELLNAATYTDRGEWDKAVEIWEGLTGNESDKIAARAFHNLAIYYELQDDIRTASSYADRAFALWENRYIKNYRQQLERRLAAQEVLLKQLR